MLQISIIGLGLMGKQHLKAIHEHPDCNIASVIDNTSEAKKIGKAAIMQKKKKKN